MQLNLDTELSSSEWLSIYDVIDNPMFIHDKEMKIRRANQAFSTLCGQPLQQILGHRYPQLLPEDNSSHGKIHPLFANDARVIDHISIGERRFKTTATPIFSPSGHYHFTVMIMEEITEQHQMQAKLSEIECKLRIAERIANLLTQQTQKNSPHLANTLCTIAREEFDLKGVWLATIHQPQKVKIVGGDGIELEKLRTLCLIEQQLHPLCPAAKAMKKRQAERLDLPNNTASSALLEYMRNLKVRSILAVPIIQPITEQLIGVITYLADDPVTLSNQNTQLQGFAANISLAEGIEALQRKHRDSKRQLQLSEQNTQRALINLIKTLTKAIEQRDPYTHGHQTRVAYLAKAIAQHMGLSRKEQYGIFLGAMIHDIGKIALPSEILSKPRKLNPTEFSLIKEHPTIGAQIIEGTDFPWPLRTIILHHHELYDGSGYPEGLKGDAIPLCARIVTVADVVEAIAAHRPYRPSLGLIHALGIIKGERGHRFDPKVVDACLDIFAQGFRFPSLLRDESH